MNNWGIFFGFYTVKPVATPPWNVQTATQKRFGDCSVYSELLRMGNAVNLEEQDSQTRQDFQCVSAKEITL